MLALIRDAVTADVFAVLVLTALVAATVRGFSGFGAAMIFVPVAAALTDPRTAVVLLLIADSLLTLPQVVLALRACVWREVLPLGAGALLTVPLGVRLLVVVDPVLMRWFCSVLILVLVAALASGWRWRRPPGTAGTAAVGGMSGLTGSMTGLSGPPVVLFWLAGHGAAMTVRANVLVFFAMTGVFNAVGYALAGLLTAERVASGVALIPAYGIGLAAGGWLFRFATTRVFRILAFTLCTFAALAGLPAFDGLR